MRRPCLWFALALVSFAAHGQTRPTLDRVEPPSWWVGFHDTHLQLLVKGQNISSTRVALSYPGVTLDSVHKAESPNYLFLDLTIGPATAPGTMTINFLWGKKNKLSCAYRLGARSLSGDGHEGLDASDVVYMVMADRFANGDPSNDLVATDIEKSVRSDPSGRHGGDLAGILSKISYLEDLGVTALWISPILESNMTRTSYHGYATTDYYTIDPRYGSNEQYRALADTLHRRHMKLVMDMVFNHCGSEHWWMRDLPFHDWIHYYPDFVRTNYATSAIFDPHAAAADEERMEQGWFDKTMPDMNEENPFVANYLIENSLWWVAYAGLDAIRMDTYPYNNKDFMARWAARVHEEYPHEYLLGEVWGSVAQEALWTTGSLSPGTNYDSHIDGVTDMPVCFATRKAFGKEGDIYELYDALSQDFAYAHPATNLVFADNHDMNRLYYVLGEDLAKFKLAMVVAMTTRGIPELFYGTEILMKQQGSDGLLRQDFPGGWPGDERDAFTEAGRTSDENDAFHFIHTLLNWRRNSQAVGAGSLTQYLPYNNVYVYGRRTEKDAVAVLINNSNIQVSLDMDRYKEILEGYESATDVLTGTTYTSLQHFDVPASTALVLQLGHPEN